MRTEILSGKETISIFAKDWDDLFKRSTKAAPYLSRVWVKVFVEEGRIRGRPLYVLVWSDNKLVGLLPLAVRKFLNQTLAEPIGTGQPSYLGLLLDPTYPSTIEYIAELFRQKKVADVLYIADLWSEDKATNALLTALQQKKFLCLRTYRNPCYQIRLGCSYDEYLFKTKSAKRRKKLRYEEKRLFATGNVEVNHYIGTKITHNVLDRAVKIQEESWMKRRGAAVLGQPFYRKLLTEMAKANFGNLWLITINGQDAAFVYAFITHRKLYYHRTAFNLQFKSSMSVGKILTMQVIRSACENNILFFDFGHGDAKYKRFWANESHRVDRVVVGRNFGGRLIALCCFVGCRLSRIKWFHSIYRKARGLMLSIKKSGS